MENIGKGNTNHSGSTRSSGKIGRIYEDAGHRDKGSGQSTILCSTRNREDTEKGVGYLRLGVLTGYQQYTG